MTAPIDTPAIAGSSLREFLHGLPGVDQVGAEARAAMLASRSVKTTAKQWALDTAISMIDLTTLEGQDTPGKVRAMCAKAKRPDPGDPTAPQVAAVCVYPDLAHLAAAEVKGTGIHVASVATAFPSGRTSLEVKLADARYAIEAGADEVDMVIDRGAFLAGDYQLVYDEIAAVREVVAGPAGTAGQAGTAGTAGQAGRAHLKVILETGELATLDNVRRASWLAMLAGADFIKTSTGKVTPAATLPGRARPPGRRQAGRRHPHRQGRRPVPGPGQRDGGGGLARSPVVPPRRLQPAERPAHAADQARHRPLLRPRLLHPGLREQDPDQLNCLLMAATGHGRGAAEHAGCQRADAAVPPVQDYPGGHAAGSVGHAGAPLLVR